MLPRFLLEAPLAEDLAWECCPFTEGIPMDRCGSQDQISVRFPPATSDEGLVAVAKLGDRSAFAELWKRHSRTAFTKVYQITKNQADTEDVIQDAWIKAFIHLNTFDGRAKFSTWLTRIAINSALMAQRRRRSRPEASLESTDGETWQIRDIVDQTKDVEEQYVNREGVERLRRAICRLNPQLRAVVEIQQSQDWQVKEIAELAGISTSAAKSRLSRARTVLRRALV
jgi:RNA polymerase sigma-70 factor, ECF subfamily